MGACGCGVEEGDFAVEVKCFSQVVGQCADLLGVQYRWFGGECGQQLVQGDHVHGGDVFTDAGLCGEHEDGVNGNRWEGGVVHPDRGDH